MEEEEKGMEGQDDVASANTNVLPAWPPRSADAPRKWLPLVGATAARPAGERMSTVAR